jgi:hypothetical protein
MRDENYFEKKLEMSKDKLAMAKRKIEHFDIQMENLIIRFDHDKKVYNDQVKHMQDIIINMQKRIPKLEKKLAKGYTHYDVRTGKAYKSFNAIHIARLEAKRLWTLDNQRKLEEKFKERQKLKEAKDRKKLSKEQEEKLISIEIQDDMQPDDEIKANQEKQIEAIQKKREYYEKELRKLDVKIPKKIIKKEISLDDLEKELMEDLEFPIPEEKTLADLEKTVDKDLIKKEPIAHIDIIETPHDDISQAKSISQQIGEVKDEINGKIKEMEWLLAYHQDWMRSYTSEEGGKAIHAGRIVNGFRQWCETKGYKIGD